MTAAQRRLLAALQVAPNLRAAARAARVAERSAWRWLQDSAFRGELGKLQDAQLEAVTGEAVRAMTEALAALLAILGDVEAPAGARVSAARAVLESGAKLFELRSLSERVAVLELRLSLGGDR